MRSKSERLQLKSAHARSMSLYSFWVGLKPIGNTGTSRTYYKNYSDNFIKKACHCWQAAQTFDPSILTHEKGSRTRRPNFSNQENCRRLQNRFDPFTIAFIFARTAPPKHQRRAQSWRQASIADEVFISGGACLAAPIWLAPHILKITAIKGAAYSFKVLLPLCFKAVARQCLNTAGNRVGFFHWKNAVVMVGLMGRINSPIGALMHQRLWLAQPPCAAEQHRPGRIDRQHGQERGQAAKTWRSLQRA